MCIVDFVPWSSTSVIRVTGMLHSPRGPGETWALHASFAFPWRQGPFAADGCVNLDWCIVFAFFVSKTGVG